MKNQLLRVLLIEDDPDDVRLLQVALGRARGAQVDMLHADRLAVAFQYLDEERFDLILLDLSLPDGQGFDTFGQVSAHALGVPIVVLTGLDDETLAVRAVGEGAQDYLIKGQLSSDLLVRAIRYALERHKMQLALRELSLRDDLTDLYNRRGFFSLASQQVKLAVRQQRAFLVMYADLDRLKWINDTFGHQEGTQALIETARILCATFRASDIITRLGGDEFVVMAIDSDDDSAEAITSRLYDHLHRHNAQANRRYDLSLSIGFVRFDPQGLLTLDEAIAKADRAMYEHKQSRGMARGMYSDTPSPV
jgi:two-component system cell cycle response regulator